ncbi:hypothetical protein GH5_01971 [Leishmania sp. Ghana 2012 LV757]|uniref:hypothetical protein n=1 Tax=Leishmania sp. Ghana 2012 LV757 TaxID=2803181 RepID=UPI001B6D2DF2|nr:hypothetical protein GH5_01971 [Leishmania sp. Ghana 2012 LV757]
MSLIPFEGSVVSYEFLGAKREWLWGIGTVTCSDERVCVIKQWVGALVDKRSTAKLESEAALSKAEAKAQQVRLLAIRERIDSQNSETSEEEKGRASQELSECLALIGKHRNHSRSLLSDIERLKASSTLQVNVQQFTPASSSVAILRSSILQVISPTEIPSVFLSSEEVDAIEKAATHSRSQLNDELDRLRSTVEAADTESTDLHLKIRALEEQRKLLGNTSRPARLPEDERSDSALSEKHERLESWESWQMWDKNAALIVSDHAITFPCNDGDTLLHHKPEETKSILTAEAAFACCVPIQCVTNPKLAACGKHLSAAFSVSHPASVTPKEIDERLAKCGFPSIHRLHEEPMGAKTGLDRAIEDLEHAFGIPEGKHEGFHFDEFMESLPDTTFSNDKDAYESEIGDLLMLLDKLNNENRSLQYTLEKSAVELKKQVRAAQKDRDERCIEVARLRDIVGKLKDLAEQQEKELEENRLHSQLVRQARFCHNLALPAAEAESSVYAVTIDEYKRQKEATDAVQAAFEKEKSKADEMYRRLQEQEYQCAQHAEHLRNLENALTAENDQTAKNCGALESELVDILLQLKASDATVAALQQLNKKQQAELQSFRLKRNASLAEREASESLTIHTPRTSAESAPYRPVPPAAIDAEPIYSITMTEYLQVTRNAATFLQQQQAERLALEHLTQELAAFRANRNAALAARDADGTLPVAARPLPADEAAVRALDPQEITDGPLYAVTLEELRHVREDAIRSAEVIDDNAAAVESELLDVLAQLKALEGENAALVALCGRKDAAVAELEKHDVRAQNSDKSKPQTSSRHQKVFEGDEWDTVVETRPHALHAAFVMDVCTACRVGRDDLSDIRFALGSLQASVTVTHNSEISCDDVAKLVEEYHYPNVWSLYARRSAPKDGLDEARDTIDMLESALAAQKADAERLADEVAAFRANRNAALAARDADGTLPVAARPLPADEAVVRALDPQEIADGPLYAVTLEEYRDKDAALEQLAAELDAQRADAERLADEVAAFRANRNAALAARDADGTLPVAARPLPADEAVVRALDPQEIADGPLYAVTLEEYRDKDAALEQLAAELDAQRADAERLAGEVAAFRTNRNAALAARDADGTLPVAARPLPADEAVVRALDPQEIADGPLYAVTLEEYRDKAAALEQLAAELDAQRADAERLADEVAAFRANRNAALAARDADGTLPVAARPLPADEAAVRALDPQEIADGPLYAVTLEEYRDKDAALEQLAAELDAQRADAERLADEVAAFRANRNAALAARDADGTLPVAARPLPADEAAVRALDPQEITDGPLYAVTLEEYRDKDAALEQLAAELDAQRADAERLADEVAAFRANRNAALAARDADGTLPVAARPLPADEAAVRALDPQEIADGPLYAVTLEELRQVREDAIRSAEVIDDNAAAVESELLDVLAQLKALEGENAALVALCGRKDAAVAELQKHDVRAKNSDKSKPQTSSRHQKVFEGDEWDTVVGTRPHALHDAFVMDVCTACRVGREDLSDIRFALGSLQASVTVTHNSEISCDDIAKLVEEYHYPNVWSLYARRSAPKDGLDEARDTISMLESALAAQRADAQRLAGEVAAFRTNRNAALAARDADGTLPVAARPLPVDEAAVRALDPQEIADGPLYAVTLEEYRDNAAALEQLAAELDAQRADAQRLAGEVAAFRTNRNAALAARDADGTLPVAARPLPVDEAAVRALDPQEIADGPLYAVTLEEYRDNAAALEQLAAELDAQRADAQRLAGEVAAFRTNRNAALAARDADGTLPVAARPLPVDEAAVRALDPQEIADGPLYAVTLEEYRDKDAALEQLAAELDAQRADAQRLAGEVAAFRTNRNAALAARDADGTLPVAARPLPVDEAAVRALDPQEIADGPLYAVTLEEYRDNAAALEQLAAELDAQRADAQRLAGEVAAFRTNRNAALAARDADGTLPVAARPLPVDEAAVRALDPQEIADGPLYAVTLEEYRDNAAALEQLAAELDAQRADAQRLAGEVAAFRTNRNAALAARDADGTLPVAARPLPVDEAAVRALDPQEIADGPLYAVTLEEYRDNAAALEQLAAELDAQRADAQRLAGEVAAFRTNRNAALAARDADGTLPVAARPLPVDEAAVRALDPQEIADGPLYAVTLEEYRDNAAALEQLAAELDAQRADAQRLAGEVAAFRTNRNAALAARDADGTLPVAARPLPVDEAAVRALDPQEIADGPLYAVTLEEYRDNAAALEQLAAELDAQRADAQRLAGEVAAFRTNRNAALAARDADGTLPVAARPLPVDEAAVRALDPQEIADGPLYAVTLEEYRDKDAALEQLAAELDAQRADAQRLAGEVAAFRTNRNAALAARDADGTLPVAARPLPVDEAAVRALDPQEIADGPLYAVTLEEYRDNAAALEQLAAELDAQRADAQRLADEVAAFRTNRNAALAARDADGTLPVAARPLPVDEAAVRALDPQEIADGPLYAVTVEELQQVREDAIRSAEVIGDNAAALESELLDVLAQLKALEGENAALVALCGRKDAAVADLQKHDVRAKNSDKSKPQTSSRHQKVFEGDEWDTVVETRPHALHDAFVMDVCTACRVGREDLSDIRFALGSLQASVTVTHNSEISCDDIAKLVEEYHYPNVWSLYARRSAPKDGLDEARDTISMLESALAAQRADAQRLADEVAAFRTNRNAALAARDADGTLPVAARPLPVDEAAVRALDPQEIADGPLYAVTLEEYRDNAAALEQLAAELDAQRADAQRLAGEVAAFRTNRNAALAARDADGTLPVAARPLPVDEAAVRALDPQEIADGPLYAVTVEELQQVREDAIRSAEVIGDNAAALESELLDVLAQLKALEGENAALVALCGRKDAAVADLQKHDVRAKNSDKSKPQTSSRHQKVFEGDEWDTVVGTRPHALHDAFVMDVCTACRVGREDLSDIRFALGSLQASVTVTHNSEISCDDIAKLVEEYHYPNVWSLYARRSAPKDGLDEARDTISMLESALAAQRADAQRLADEVAAFRTNRNAALAARDADGTLPVAARPLPVDEAAVRALDPQEIADGPLYAVTLEEYRDNAAALEQLAAELDAQRADAQRLADEVAAFRTNRNAALAARDADGTLPVAARPLPVDEAAVRALDPQEIADGPLYAVTLEEYRDNAAALEQLAAELDAQRADAQRLAGEVAAFRTNRNAALAARDADGTLPVAARPLPVDEAAVRALDPQEIADGPLYAVTLEEYRDNAAALEQLAAELDAQRADAQRLAGEVAAFRTNRNAALAARDADGTLPVAARPLPVDEAAVRALDPQEIADGPLYAVTLEEYRDNAAALEQLAAELDAQRADAQRLAGEVAAFRTNRNAALAARDADGTLPVAARPLPVDEAAVRALDPQEIADGPLYAVTLEEYRDNAAALEQLAAELDAQRADAQRLAGEVAAFRTNRNAALAARDADGTLPVAARPLPVDEAAVRALDPQEIADGPLYAVTLEEYRDNAAALEQLAAELDAQRADAQRLADEVAAFRTNRNAALAARDADGTLPVAARPLPVDEAAVRALDPQEIADGPLYAVTVEELQQVREDAIRSAEVIGDNAAALESELLDVLAQLKALEGENAALVALCGRKDAAVADLQKHDVRAKNSDKSKPQTSSRHQKVFEGDEWDTVVGTRPHALHDAFVMDVCTACRVGREDLSDIRFALGSLQASVTVTHNSEISCDDIAKLVEEYHYPNVWSLYARRSAPKDGLDEARDTISMLESALAAQRADAQRLAGEVAAFRTNRNAALAARDADGTLPVAARPLPVDEAAVRALDPQEIADGPLYAVTLEEYRDNAAALEQLAAELDAQRADAQRLAGEVAAFRTNRNAALAARDADGTLPVAARPLPVDEAAVRALDPQEIADGPLYAVTLEEYRDNAAALEQLAAELDAQRADAQRLAGEVAAFRTNRNAALAARDADGTLPVAARPLPVDEAAVRALDPQEIADGPLYAVTLEEYRDNAAALEQLAAELDAQRADAQRLAGEVAAFRTNRNAALAARDADGTLPVAARPLPVDEAAVRALDPQEIADGPLYAVTLEEYRDNAAALEQLAAELDAQRADAQRLAGEVAAFRTNRNAALAARDADGTLPVAARPLPVDEAAVRALDPQEIADGPLYAVTLEELRKQRDLNSQMVVEFDALGERVRGVTDPKLYMERANDDVISYLEALVTALEQSRDAEQAARDVAEERERELTQLRKLFENEEERFKSDLEEGREEVERLQGELDLLTDKLDEACRLFGDADAVNAEGVAKLEAFAEVLAAARDAEKDAVEQLETKENELEELRIALRETVGREEALEKLEDEVALLQKEKDIMETELTAAQKEMNDLRHDLRAAEDRAEDKAREVERMTLDLDALNIRIQDLLEELEEKTDQYNQVIKDLDDFAKNQSRGDEKELLQQLAAREQELFELLEARRGENDEHEKQVGVLQDQINRLRDQTEQDNTLHDGLQGELARLHQLLADTESALRDKTAENESLRDDIEGMMDEHEAQMCEMEQELEGKSKEVSDALERLEEMSAMVQEAREGEESALRLRADSDAEVFRLQKELDKMKQLQSAMAESGDDKGRLLAQMLDTEGQLRDAEATIRKKDVERGEAEKEWREKLKTSEGLNVDLRRLLKQTMSALSKSRDTMGNSAGALDAFRDELKPMLQ